MLFPVMAAALSGWALRAVFIPPRARICGSPGGPPVTSPRIKLNDGRYLAYREWGVPRESARHKIIFVHPFRGSKDIPLNVSQELLEEWKVCMISYDRDGYGESSPNPRRTVSGEADDIRQLADQLGLDRRFFLIGTSMGGCACWSCIKHIPDRLAGVALLCPAVNYWWPSLPAALSRGAFRRLDPSDQRVFWIARHAPWLVYAYMNQKLVTPSKLFISHPDVLCPQDKEILQTIEATANPDNKEGDKTTQQGEHESLHRDLISLVRDWGFDPADLPDPFPGGEGFIHVWQGMEDKMVPPDLQRHVAGNIPWVRYHELPGAGHLFDFLPHNCEAILRELLHP